MTATVPGAGCRDPAPGHTDDGLTYYVNQAVICLAGRRAEKRGLQGSEPGWQRVLDREQRIALHEAGHALVALKLGQFVYEAAIITEPGINAGYIKHGATPQRPPEKPLRKETDERSLVRRFAPAVALAWYGSIGFRCIRACIRMLTAQTDEMLAADWPLVWHVANALLQERTLSQERIAMLLAPRRRRWSE